MMKPLLVYALLNLGLLAFASETPRLKSGDIIPEVTVHTEEARPVTLRQLTAEKPAVLIFYRGGWCPFCTRHLKELAGIQDDLRALGFQLIALSIDKPEKLRQTPHRESLGYQLLSDSDAAAARAFGIAFQVEDSLVKKYKDSYQIDLEEAAGKTHHLLPHPAVYVVDQQGKIRFAHVNEDYKERLDPKAILTAARESTIK